MPVPLELAKSVITRPEIGQRELVGARRAPGSVLGCSSGLAFATFAVRRGGLGQRLHRGFAACLAAGGLPSEAAWAGCVAGCTAGASIGAGWVAAPLRAKRRELAAPHSPDD